MIQPTERYSRRPTLAVRDGWVSGAVFGLGLLGLATAAGMIAAGALPPLVATAAAGGIAVVVAAWRPSWLIYMILAIPPGLALTSPILRPRNVALLIGLVLALHWVRTGSRLGFPRAYLPFAGLIVLSFLFPTGSSAANAVATILLQSFVYYLLLGILAYRLFSRGELRIDHAVAALFVGLIGTGVVLIVETGGSLTLLLPGAEQQAQSTLLFARGHFGYTMAIGFGAAVGAFLARPRFQGFLDSRLIYGALSVYFLIFVALSYRRGPWLVALIMILTALWASGRRRYWVLVLITLILLATVPLFEDRLTGGARGDIGEVLASKEFTTGRSEVWSGYWREAKAGFPLGHGFGHTWTLSPESLLSGERFGSGDIVYPHNDFLFWLVEFGLLGLLLLSLFWVAIFRALIRAARALRKEHHLALMAAAVAMFAGELFANGLFLGSLSERFFVFSGILLSASKDHRTEDRSLAKSQLRQEVDSRARDPLARVIPEGSTRFAGDAADDGDMREGPRI